MKRVGILGAGQLGCMLAESLFKFGAEVFFYDTQPHSPGYYRTPNYFCGEWNDEKKLFHFFSSCDVVTYEFENVSVELLDSLVAQTKTPLYPSAHVLSTTQNRINEKNFLKNNAFPVCQFAPIFSNEDLQKLIQSTAFPYIIKTATGGYDGKGQWKISCQKDIENLLKEINLLQNGNKIYPLILEEFVPISKEVSCITARNKHGQIVTFPVFENEHRDHILYQTILPAEISETISIQLQTIAKEACQKLNLIGLLTTEFFITKENSIYINEFAPRPHNSGHITRVACSISQFEMHARILLDLPLHTPALHQDFYCMGNMLGDLWKSNTINLDSWKNNSNIIEIMLYGKAIAKEKRKMGHFIASQSSRKQVLLAADKLRKDLCE